MQALLKSGEKIKIEFKIAKYCDLLTQLMEDEEFFSEEEQTEQEILKLELSFQEWSKYKFFCEKINKHLAESGYENFKANHFFAEEYFKDYTDDALLIHYKVAEYLHSDVLRESLHWYLGGMFRNMELSEIEDLYLGPQTESEKKKSKIIPFKKMKNKRFKDERGEFAELEYAEILNDKLLKELKTQMPQFEKEDMDFMDEWLVGKPVSEINGPVRSGIIHINQNN